MKRLAKFVLRLLLLEKKEHRAAVANDLIQTATNEPDFLKKVTTGDESWVCGRDPERKAQSSQCKLPGSPRLKKVGQSCSKIKTMLTVFIDWKGVVHHKYTPLQAKQLIRSTSSMFFVSGEMQYDQNGLCYGQLVIGSFITTTRPLTHHVSNQTSNHPGD